MSVYKLCVVFVVIYENWNNRSEKSWLGFFLGMHGCLKIAFQKFTENQNASLIKWFQFVLMSPNHIYIGSLRLERLF